MKKELKQIYCPLCGSEKSKTIFTHARLANIKRTYASKESIKQFMNCRLLFSDIIHTLPCILLNIKNCL